MTNHDKELQQLLQASHAYLKNPEDQTKWLAFQKALQTVEAIEKAEALLAQPETLKNPSQETKQILRRYYEEQLRPQNRAFIWSSILIAVVIGLTLLGVTRGIFTPLTLAGFTATPTITSTQTPSPTVTWTPIPSSTFTATVLPTRTAVTATKNAVTPIVSPTITDTSTATETATNTPSPTLTPVPTATLIPPFTTGTLVGTLTSDHLSRQHLFRGQSGDVVTIQLNSQDFDPNLSILNSKGTEIASNDDCGSLRKACIGPITLPSDDVYRVIVDSFTRRATGSYTLKIQVTHLASTATPTPTPACHAPLPNAVIVTKEDSIRLHPGPGQSTVIGFGYNGECFQIIGRNSNNLWLKILLPSGRQAWLSASLTQIQGSLNLVPIVPQ